MEDDHERDRENPVSRTAAGEQDTVPTPSPWPGRVQPIPAHVPQPGEPKHPRGVVLPSDRPSGYEPPSAIEHGTSWYGPSAYLSAREEPEWAPTTVAPPPIFAPPTVDPNGQDPRPVTSGAPSPLTFVPSASSPPTQSPGPGEHGTLGPGTLGELAMRAASGPTESANPDPPAGPAEQAGPAPPAVLWAPLVAEPAGVPGMPGHLSPGDLLPSRKPYPTSGVRGALYRISGRRLNLGLSAHDQSRLHLLERAKTPAASGRRRIAMISLKGGVGKTTTTVMLGHTLAEIRGDNVIAVDANPDAGNLASRIRRQTDQTARDLLRASGSLDRYADVRSFTSQAESRLEVLAGESDPALSEAFSASDYEAVLAALERFYSVVLTDCGTGILHDAMRAVLWYVDQLIVVTSPSIDSAHALGQLLDWLDQHGYHHLVRSGIVAVNGVRKRSEIRVEQFASTFGSRCRGVVTIPYDSTLSTGGEALLDALAPTTRQAYLELAAAVADGFGEPRLHGHDPGRP